MATAFDPDAFLKQTAPPPPFDPDVFLGLKSYGSAVPQVNAQGQVMRQPDAIPGERPGMRDVLGAIVETPLALGTGIVASTVAPYAGLVRSLTGGQYGTQEGVRQGQELAGRVQQALTYQPQTRGGQATMQTIGEIAEPLGAIPFAQGSNVAALAPSAIRQAGNIARTEGGYLKSAIGEIPSVKAGGEERVAGSYARAPQIDAAKLAQEYGIALDPAASNPSVRNRARTGLIGSADVDIRLSESNKPKWTNIVKKDLGIGDEVSLTDPKVYDNVRARNDIAGPYETVRNIKQVRVTADALDNIDKLRAKELYVDDGQAAQVGAYLDNLKEGLLKGGDGSKLLDTIRQMRQEASNVFRTAGPIDPNAKAMADAKLGAAKVLEGLIDNNLPNAQARADFINARTKMAQTYDMESATNFGTGQIDPNVFAKLVSEGKPVTGVVADIGKIVSNFPDIAALSVGDKKLLPTFTRAGAGGAIGGLIGSVLGTPAIGGPIGIALGAGTSEILRRVAANRMTSPEFQTGRAMPPDYRPQQIVNNLRPVEPGQSNIVPFNPVNALVEPEIRPNFVFGRGEAPVDVQPVPPGAGPRQIGMDSPADVTARLRAEDARRTRMAQMAEAEGLAAEGRGRAPTSGEVLFDLDPVSRKFVPVSQGIRGATPETFQDYTATLRSAIDKMSGKKSSIASSEVQRVNDASGNPLYFSTNKQGTKVGEKGSRGFDMTLAEKVAFDKTRVDLAEVAPGFKALNDRAIADKMMDRNWVEDTLQKAREKDAAFAEIESRARSPEMMGARADSAKNAEMLRQATEARDRVKSSIELLEDQLRQMRPDTSRKQQGPKTRAAKRNALRGDDEILNKLVP
jgi:hypothetical protein